MAQIFEAAHGKRIFIQPNSKCSGEPPHLSSLARAFAVAQQYIKLVEASDNESEIWPHWVDLHACLKNL